MRRLRPSLRSRAWIIQLDRTSADVEQGPSMLWSVCIAVAVIALLNLVAMHR